MNVLTVVVSGVVGGVLGAGLALATMGRNRAIAWRVHFGDGRTLIGVLLLTMMVLSAVLYYRAASSQTRIVECQAQQNEALAQAINARAQANLDGDQAQREFLQAATPGIDPAAKTAAINRYLGALDKIDSTRAANPLIAGGCT
jgi:hypothetical protein